MNAKSPYNMNPDPWPTPHTPGPWHYHNGAVYMRPFPDTSGCIANMDREEPETAPFERVANARLIAAAPELLEVLRKAHLNLLDALAYATMPEELRQNILASAEQARAVIAKAERSAYV